MQTLPENLLEKSCDPLYNKKSPRKRAEKGIAQEAGGSLHLPKGGEAPCGLHYISGLLRLRLL